MEKNYLLWLSRIKKVGIKKKLRAIDYFKNSENIFKATKSQLISSNIFTANNINYILEDQKESIIKEYLEELENYKMHFVSISCPDYPHLLKNIIDPPIVLYYYGTLPNNKISISIVGTRICSQYGKEITYPFSRDLGKNNICIVSGMASGIDSVAHTGITDNIGTTIAVLGNSVDICYPSHNESLRREIIKKGAIISEYPPNTKPLPSYFPARNRIISGLSQGIAVVEAPKKSGSLITVNFGLEQGRDIFAFPGNIFSKNSVGTNELIKDGAYLITSYKDILDFYGISEDKEEIKKINLQILEKIDNLSDIEKNIYELITIEGTTVEFIIGKTKLEYGTVLSNLTFLEIKGLIKRIPGQKFALKI